MSETCMQRAEVGVEPWWTDPALWRPVQLIGGRSLSLAELHENEGPSICPSFISRHATARIRDPHCWLAQSQKLRNNPGNKLHRNFGVDKLYTF